MVSRDARRRARKGAGGPPPSPGGFQARGGELCGQPAAACGCGAVWRRSGSGRDVSGGGGQDDVQLGPRASLPTPEEGLFRRHTGVWKRWPVGAQPGACAWSRVCWAEVLPGVWPHPDGRGPGVTPRRHGAWSPAAPSPPSPGHHRFPAALLP